MSYLTIAVAIYCAYLMGSISSAIITCKIMGLPDPRSSGSNNPGATNVLRVGGKKAALITLIGDALKGFIPVILAKHYGFDPLSLSLIAFAAFLGHLWPIFFRFEGGKGVATALGVMLALSYPVALVWLAIWLTIATLFRYSSLAALLASITAPFYMWFIMHNIYYCYLMIAITLLLLLRHRSNILNLWYGTEKKLGKKK